MLKAHYPCDSLGRHPRMQQKKTAQVPVAKGFRKRVWEILWLRQMIQGIRQPLIHAALRMRKLLFKQ